MIDAMISLTIISTYNAKKGINDLFVFINIDTMFINEVKIIYTKYILFNLLLFILIPSITVTKYKY